MAITKKKVTKKLRLDLKGIPLKDREAARDKVGEFIVDKIEEFLDRSSSPVADGSYKKLKKDKKPSKLEKTGLMRSLIGHESIAGGIEIGVFESSEAPKAFNHNTGDTLPQREFIPSKEKEFKKSIMNGIDKILDGFKDGN